jgi:hypothetical protein
MLRKVAIHISQVRLQWFVSYEPQITIFQSVEMLLFLTILLFSKCGKLLGYLCNGICGLYKTHRSAAHQLINTDLKQFSSTSPITFLVTSHYPKKRKKNARLLARKRSTCARRIFLNGLELSEAKQIRRLEFLSYLEEKMESITQGDITKHG